MDRKLEGPLWIVRRWARGGVALGRRFGLASRFACLSYLAVLAIGIGPIIIGALLPARFGYYSPGHACLCGHRAYWFIKDDRIVEASFGHNMFSEIWSVKSGRLGKFDLYDWSSEQVGELTVQRHSLQFSFRDGDFTVPLVWNIWRVWHEQWATDDLGEGRYEALEYWQALYPEVQAHKERKRKTFLEHGNAFGLRRGMSREEARVAIRSFEADEEYDRPFEGWPDAKDESLSLPDLAGSMEVELEMNISFAESYSRGPGLFGGPGERLFLFYDDSRTLADVRHRMKTAEPGDAENGVKPAGDERTP